MENSIKSYNDAAVYVESLTGYYLDVFKKIKDKDLGISWNWYGFFFSLGWMIYRKMYLSAITVYVICVFIGLPGYFLMEFLSLNYNHVFFHLYAIIILLASSIVTGCFGNCWYKKHIDELIEEGKYFCMAKKRYYIKRAGGTSIPPVVIFVTINLGILYLANLG